MFELEILIWSTDRVFSLEILIRSAVQIFDFKIVIRSVVRIFDLEILIRPPYQIQFIWFCCFKIKKHLNIKFSLFDTFYLILKVNSRLCRNNGTEINQKIVLKTFFKKVFSHTHKENSMKYLFLRFCLQWSKIIFCTEKLHTISTLSFACTSQKRKTHSQKKKFSD